MCCSFELNGWGIPHNVTTLSIRSSWKIPSLVSVLLYRVLLFYLPELSFKNRENLSERENTEDLYCAVIFLSWIPDRGFPKQFSGTTSFLMFSRKDPGLEAVLPWLHDSQSTPLSCAFTRRAPDWYRFELFLSAYFCPKNSRDVSCVLWCHPTLNNMATASHISLDKSFLWLS